MCVEMVIMLHFYIIYINYTMHTTQWYTLPIVHLLSDLCSLYFCTEAYNGTYRFM